MVRIDEEFQTLIPPLTDDEFQRLERSILDEGVREPIITWNGVIVDGHNRYNITQKHALVCPTRERQFESRDAAKIWIIENQFARRNLNSYNRSVLALKLEPLYAAEAKRRQGTRTDIVQNSAPSSDTGKTRDKVAKAAGVSHDTIRKVKVIEAEANKGNEKAIELRNAIQSGDRSINNAFNSITGKKVARPIEETTTEDGRRICSICGKPINPGEARDYEPTYHRKCRAEQNTITQRKYRDADKCLRENVAVYNLESLKTELKGSAGFLEEAWKQSLEINESMGVRLTEQDKSNLLSAIDRLYTAINDIQKEG